MTFRRVAYASTLGYYTSFKYVKVVVDNIQKVNWIWMSNCQCYARIVEEMST